MNEGKKYAQGLVGKWATEQYDKQRKVSQDTYNTNWKALQQQFENLRSRLDTQDKQNRQAYGDVLGDVASSSMNKEYAAVSDLANRGVLGGGQLERITQEGISDRGANVQSALNSVLSGTTANTQALSSGIDTYNEKSGEMGQGLVDTMTNIGDTEKSNIDAYNNLITSIAEASSSRQANNRISRASRSSGGSKEEDDLNALYDRMAVYYILKGENPETGEAIDDETKKMMLRTYYDIKNPETMISKYTSILDKQANYEGDMSKQVKTIKALQNKLNKKSSPSVNIPIAGNLLGRETTSYSPTSGNIAKQLGNAQRVYNAAPTSAPTLDIYNLLYGNNR